MRVHVRACIAAAMLGCMVAALADSERQRIGRAYDRATGELLYVETHAERLDGDRVVASRVSYAGPDGARFAEKSVDFSSNPEMPRFRFENEATGHVEALESGQEGPVVVFRESREDAFKRVPLSTGDAGIVDAGFDRFIERNWELLARDGAVVRPFLIPSRGDFIDFRIRTVEPREAGEASFVLEVDSALLRLIVAPVRVDYSAADRTLLRYAGISNVRDGEGDNYDVSIVFGGEARQLARSQSGDDTVRRDDAPRRGTF